MPDTRIRSFLWIKGDLVEERKMSPETAPVFTSVEMDLERVLSVLQTDIQERLAAIQVAEDIPAVAVILGQTVQYWVEESLYL